MTLDATELDDSKRWNFTFYQQWSAILTFWRDWNWIDFTVFKLAFETSSYHGRRFEVDLCIFGFCFGLDYWGRKNERWLKTVAEVDQIKAELRDGDK